MALQDQADGHVRGLAARRLQPCRDRRRLVSCAATLLIRRRKLPRPPRSAWIVLVTPGSFTAIWPSHTRAPSFVETFAMWRVRGGLRIMLHQPGAPADASAGR